jgi:hypothetical protein
VRPRIGQPAGGMQCIAQAEPCAARIRPPFHDRHERGDSLLMAAGLQEFFGSFPIVFTILRRAGKRLYQAEDRPERIPA